jgi:hypothetical protein
VECEARLKCMSARRGGNGRESGGGGRSKVKQIDAMDMCRTAVGYHNDGKGAAGRYLRTRRSAAEPENAWCGWGAGTRRGGERGESGGDKTSKGGR